MGMFTEWRDDAYATLQAKYAKLEADYKRLLEGDDWTARCIRLENLHKDLVDEHRVTKEQLAEARAENAALVAEFQRLANEPPTLEEIAADLDKIEMLEKELAEARAEIERLNQSDYAYETIEEYENIVGYKVGEAFRLGWAMARTKMSHLHAMAAERINK